MNIILKTAAATMLAGSAAAYASHSSDNNPTLYPTFKSSDTVRFIVVGDTGTGGKGQQQVADAIYQVCQARGCDFALALGDNVYQTGVTGVDDEQFNLKFEQPYAKLNFPFYMAIGNHDDPHSGKDEAGATDSGSFEVAYTYEHGKPSNKWQLPARYYSVDMPDQKHPLVTFLSIDGASLAGKPSSDQAPTQLDYIDREGHWLDEEIQSSSAPWKIAFSHFPLYSNGKHGNAGEYGGRENQGVMYKTLITEHVCDKADVLFAGHDHDLQWLKPKPECGKTVQIVSGAGAKKRELGDENRNDALWQAGDTLGFFYVELTAGELEGTVYTVDDDDGEYREAFHASINKAAVHKQS